MDRNLHRYIIRRSLRLQLVLIAIAFVLGLALNPFMLNLQKRIINEAIGQRNFDALLWLCGGFLGAVLANGALQVREAEPGRVHRGDDAPGPPGRAVQPHPALPARPT